MTDKTGVLYLRMSSRLKKKLQAIACENNVSLNQFVNACLEQAHAPAED